MSVFHSDKVILSGHPAVTDVIAEWYKTLEGRGRIVVRASGTEPYIRVMVEGESLDEINTAASEIAAAIRTHLI